MLPRRRLALTLALFALLTLTGCGPRWIVLSQASPNVLAGQQVFAVNPVDFSDLRVGNKGEGAYLAEKSEQQRAAWADDKAAINDRFTESLMKNTAERGMRVVLATGPTSAPFFLRAHAARIEPGFYAAVVSGNGYVTFEITITTADGRPIDRIMLELPAGGFSVTQRVTASATGAGAQLARYLHLRSAGNDD